ncbi:MAG: glycosyltransferase family 39 protein [Acidobacteria bacterium]|nr:glycosyltransferase family 39 protein [Acidobacteriota bacterium]
MTAPRWVPIAALLIASLFFGLGSLWIAWPGPEYDETLFVLASFPRPDTPLEYAMKFRNSQVALMLDTYLGALKGWLYRPILQMRPGSMAWVRRPVLLLGALSIYLLYLFARRAFGWQTALLALALAATDPIYLFTTRLDWGPVAIQHFCLLAGCWGVLRWWQERRGRDLALAFFVMGVGIWDKATFLWLLAALALSAAIVFPRQLRDALRPRAATIATAAMLLGAAPFVYYNLKRPGATFRQQADRTSQYAEKMLAARYVLEGVALVGWITADMDGSPLDPPDRLARAIYQLAPREPLAKTLLLPASILALLLLPALPFTPWGRGMLFALSFCVLAFVQMLPIRNAGAAHHLALLLPFPQLFVAAGLLGAWERMQSWLAGRGRWIAHIVLWAVVMALLAMNLRAVAHHYFRILGYGGSSGWSEATYSLQHSLEQRRPDKAVLLDWGMATQLRALTGDRLPLEEASQPQGPSYNAGYLARDFSNPRVLYVQYTAGAPPAFPQIAEAFLKLAAARGYGAGIVETVKDRRGRAIYELLSLQPPPAASSPPDPSR